jgi:hypothetical protein
VLFWYACVLFSILLVLLFNPESQFILNYGKGVMVWTMYLVIFISIIMNTGYVDRVLKGISSGFILNLFFCVYQYFAIENGWKFVDLSSLFPQSGYGHEVFYYKFLYGFFFEPAHMLRFFCGAYFITRFLVLKTTKSKLLIDILLAFVIVASTSSLSAVLLLFLLLYWTILAYKRMIYLSEIKKICLIVAVITCLVIVILVFFSNALDFVFSSFEIGLKYLFEGVQISNSSYNYERFSNMVVGLQAIKDYPMGTGINCMPLVMSSQNYPAITVEGATFNGLITLFIEVGLVGVICYINMFFRKINMLVIKSKEKKTIIVGLALMATTVCTLLEGYIVTELIVVLLGIAYLLMANIKKNNFVKDSRNGI